jgi:hypothetical protein
MNSGPSRHLDGPSDSGGVGSGLVVWVLRFAGLYDAASSESPGCVLNPIFEHSAAWKGRARRRRDCGVRKGHIIGACPSRREAGPMNGCHHSELMAEGVPLGKWRVPGRVNWLALRQLARPSPKPLEAARRIWSARRNASAMIVSVGAAVPAVGKTELPAM